MKAFNGKTHLFGALVAWAALSAAVPAFLFGAEEADKNVVQVTDGTFDRDVLKSQAPVLVDFWASWCTGCKQISSSVSQMADDYKGSLKVAKVNVEDNPGIPRRYGVNGLPTVLVFNNGKMVKKWVGNISQDKIKKEIESLLATGPDASK